VQPGYLRSEGGDALKRVLLVLTVALMMAAMVLLMASPAFAQQTAGRITDPTCDPVVRSCTTGGGRFTEGPGGGVEGGTFSGGGTVSNPDGTVQGFGGRILFGDPTANPSQDVCTGHLEGFANC